MNTNFNNGPIYPNTPFYSENIVPNGGADFNFEQSYIENIMRLNKGKKVSIYASFADANEWKDKIFKGIIEESGRDHVILSDPSTGKWYMILMIYVNFVEFDEKINYLN